MNMCVLATECITLSNPRSNQTNITSYIVGLSMSIYMYFGVYNTLTTLTPHEMHCYTSQTSEKLNELVLA